MKLRDFGLKEFAIIMSIGVLGACYVWMWVIFVSCWIASSNGYQVIISANSLNEMWIEIPMMIISLPCILYVMYLNIHGGRVK